MELSGNGQSGAGNSLQKKRNSGQSGTNSPDPETVSVSTFENFRKNLSNLTRLRQERPSATGDNAGQAQSKERTAEEQD
jgi:hypothetical protein